MSLIRILPEKVALQIAAGEVIERPASVVRELLDNSIDAQADRITVKIEKGGRTFIRVSDNGKGMDRDDLLLSIERHATSKIRSTDDLFSIRTLGFRGEALPSISSVSRVEITSRPHSELVGHKLKVHGGKLVTIEETGAPAGTVIDVRDLFFNTPARRKFLRSVKTETALIIDTVSRLAMPFTRIHFKVDEQEKNLLNLPASEEMIQRLGELLGRSIVANLMEIRLEEGGLCVWGYAAPPETCRARGDRIYVYVNGRNVRDRLIARAVMEGYGRRLMKGRYPQIVLFVDLDPGLVDFNVHPAKQEIRFREAQAVYRAVLTAVDKGLGRYLQPLPPVESPVFNRYGDKTPVQIALSEPEWEYRPTNRSPAAATPEPVSYPRLHTDKAYRIIGQLKDTYILCETEDGLLMIDQHAAHERVVYESLLKAYAGSSPEIQTFLIPFHLEVSPADRRILEKRLEDLRALGLNLEHFGGSSFILRSVPSILLGVQWDRFISDLLPILEEESDLGGEKAVGRILTTMACHSAVRAGKRMTMEEMDLLLGQLRELEIPTHCPHGRPVFRRFTFYEIEKMFRRVV